MVAQEIVDEDQQLEVRIIRTKGGIKNVAYIADNENSLIVQQRTTTSSSKDPDSNIFTKDGSIKCHKKKKENISSSKNCKFAINNANILHEDLTLKDCTSSKMNHNQAISSESLDGEDIDVNVVVKKVH